MQDIEIYYESIKQVYNQILEWKTYPKSFLEKVAAWLIGVALVVFLLSLIPILPSVIIFSGSQFGWQIGSFNLTQAGIGTYAIAWLIGGIVSFLLFLLALWSSDKLTRSDDRERRKASQTLSSEQLTFIFVYEAYKELKIYFISHIDQHISNSLQCLRKIEHYGEEIVYVEERTGRRRLSPEEAEMIYLVERPSNRVRSATPSLPRQISVAQEFLRTFEKYAWFHLDDTTKSRLQALISFQTKLLVRLRKREDLPAVLSILENLSKFIYAFLPEHQTNKEPEALEKLQAEGAKCLDRFVSEVNKLTDYPPEPQPDMVATPQRTWLEKVQVFFSSNVFFRFTIWFILLLTLTSGLVYLISLRVQQLDINVMVSMIIATSITGAAALAVFGERNANLEIDSKNQVRNVSSKNPD